ncbi:hypothetical protein [Caballeronia insecticola]|uniref:Uncharacterized protein n=1 Tax=Caballeronia insecticola TaxID=758793 RepID=R4WPF0_9BURK|nr:hypothetical protein [Caballeronia insecticola]BAN26464.1 hypothetical protein BRPE64_CCDS03810 [Caballeronia insecticola]
MKTHSAADDAEDRHQSQLRRIAQLEEENAALKEVNAILRKAVAYYTPVCAPLFESDSTSSLD